MTLDRIVESKVAALVQLHEGGRNDRLGKGLDAECSLGRHPFAGLDVGDSKGACEDDVAAENHGERGARYAAAFELSFDGRRDAVSVH